MLRNVKITAVLFALLVVILAGSALAQGVSTAPTTGPVSARPIGTSGVNVDVHFSSDPICGFAFFVHGEEPSNFYLGTQNPWGNPTVTDLGGGNWLVVFGGAGGPCFSRDDSRFWDTGHTVFLGLHFGFTTTDPTLLLIHRFGGSVSAVCFEITEGGFWIPGPRLTGHSSNDIGFQVNNTNATAAVMLNAQIAVSSAQVPIDDLARHSLGKLEWQDLHSDSVIVPAGSDDAPGTLSVAYPDFGGQKGWGVVAYDLADPKTQEVYATVTFEFPLP
jgi:hypothetical protein